MTAPPFHGSYAADDVTFLLQPLALAPTADLLEKERLIQSGVRHYSEMLSAEQPPTPAYLALFDAAVETGAARMARDLVHLARRIRALRGDRLTLVSLARAGTPVGVLLRRLLRLAFDIDAPHYSLSVIRDRGVDAAALAHVLVRHSAQSIVFVDGWTAKGAIWGELRRCLAGHGGGVAPELFVLCDLAGIACAAGSSEDYLIPSALLNACVSGLVSRSFLNAQIAPGAFHGCVHYRDWTAHDRSRWFVDRIAAELARNSGHWLAETLPDIDTAAVRERSLALMSTLSQRHAVNDLHLIKPGIGEATRALLRRAPRLLLLRDRGAADVRHLLQLAGERGVAVEDDPTLGLQAAVVIQSLADG